MATQCAQGSCGTHISPPAHVPSSHVPCIHRRPALCRRLARWQRLQAGATGPSASDPAPWYDSLNRGGIRGPSFGPTEGMNQEEEPGVSIMGEDGYKEWVEIKKGERQRVWDSMRASAADRYAKGEMPAWFNPAWLTQQESPVNRIIREMGDPRYQSDDTWLGRSYEPMLPPEELQFETQGGGGDDGSGQGGRRGDPPGGGWWREDDPYWMMRDWGSHPMRWYTLGFAAIMALGGVLTFSLQGSVESLFIGWGSAAALSVCALAMSDMRTGVTGELGVKAAWVVCALIGIKDAILGWAHMPNSGTRGYNYQDPTTFLREHTQPAPWEFLILKFPKLNPSACGWTAAAMCTMLMWTGMGQEVDGSLPMNPGGVYKSPNIVLKHHVWKRWGYGDATMRV